MIPVVILAGGLAVGWYVRWRRRSPVRMLARRLREFRAQAEGALALRACTPDDSELVELLWRIEADERELEAVGFEPLGDLILQPDGGEIRAVLRVLIDATGTTCAYLSVYPHALTDNTLILESHLPDGLVSTRRIASSAALASSPFVRRQFVHPGVSPTQLVARHRAFAGLGDPAAPFERITTIAQLLDVQRRAHDRNRRWRADQPAGELLEADLRSMLGEYYDLYGGPLTLRLSTPPPTAIALRRR